ncbi:hypothetical protein VOLCADRAFT_118310 [Volvox carteri f. nagariensis]|uniref:Protein kinase domain-containing protein n=1 Tax=Volvox carteri f. nagariensis TaxID=3068 RepID=D8U3P7_VOLCA|nr:uncharacterized protein VOLCADRAFT_118310 [Volvox carteri f. nagariensis]EFJ45567.1 hypothetical protein VOLCADRAFT_118310 [Volvox carteri f. nagariensis]|eukprot:XP_002953257.1 hypothetical protein VOLCADRAFT_118310 [Volvox carteri f. nagariensis]
MPLFGKGFRIGTGPDQDRWLIVKKLGEGQFAEVYEVKDTMDSEKRVLKKIQERAPSLVCTVHACGTFEDRFFMIMELLGSNVAEARKAAGGRFDLTTVRRLATSMLQSHLKSSRATRARFAGGASTACTSGFVSISFLMVVSCSFTAFSWSMAASCCLFKITPGGSTTYASVHAHAEQDLGRRDDLWSWLYCTIELLEGTLPWRTDQNKDPDSRDAVLRMKQACIAEPSRYLRSAAASSAGGAAGGGSAGSAAGNAVGPHHPLLQPLLLGPIHQLSNYIASLGFADAPDYGLMYGYLLQLPDDDLGGLISGSGHGSLAAAAGMWGAGMPGTAEAHSNSNNSNTRQHRGTPREEVHRRRKIRDARRRWTRPRRRRRKSTAPVAASVAASEPPPLADLPSEVAEAMLAEALAERAGAEQSREAAQVAEVHEYVELIKQGHVSDEAHVVAGRLMGLEPLEALATISYVLDALASHAAPATANTAAVALSALGAYARDAAKRAMINPLLRKTKKGSIRPSVTVVIHSGSLASWVSKYHT